MCQVFGVGNAGKTIVRFCKGELILFCLMANVFMSIEYDLGVKRGMGAEFYGQMPPIQDP
jgi:hypothetical protein